MDYAVTVLYTSQITTGHTRFSQSVIPFTNCCLVAASNGGRSPSSGFPNCPRPQLPASHSNSSHLNTSCYNSLSHSFSPNLFALITSRQGPHRKHHSSLAVYGPLSSNGRCTVLISLSLPSNGHTCIPQFRILTIPSTHPPSMCLHRDERSGVSAMLVAMFLLRGWSYKTGQAA
jgi:hypothetical protein